MTQRVFSRLIACSVVFLAIHLRLPVPATAQSAAVPPAPPALAERLDRLAAEFDRHRVDLRVAHRYITSNEATGRAIFQVERVEAGLTLAPDTFVIK